MILVAAATGQVGSIVVDDSRAGTSRRQGDGS